MTLTLMCISQLKRAVIYTKSVSFFTCYLWLGSPEPQYGSGDMKFTLLC